MSIYRDDQGRPTCPACYSKSYRLEPDLNGIKSITGQGLRDGHILGLYACRKCNALFGDGLYLGESYEIVKPFLVPEQPGDAIRYFDFTCLGSQGLTRRHGWYVPATGMMVQAG